MQLEVGKNYVTRSGEIVEVVAEFGIPGQPPATFGKTMDTADYYPDGRRLWGVDGPNDIVAYLPFRFYADDYFPHMFAVCDDGTCWWLNPETGEVLNQSELAPEEVTDIMSEVIPLFRCEVKTEPRYRWIDTGGNVAWWRWDTVEKKGRWIGKIDINEDEDSAYSLEDMLVCHKEIPEPAWLPSKATSVPEREVE